MRIGADPGAEQVGGIVVPDDPRSGAVRRSDRCDLRRIERSAGLGGTANGAGAVVGTMLAALIAIARARSDIGVANLCSRQWIGRGNGSRPARADRREDLHHQRDQNDRKKFF